MIPKIFMQTYKTHNVPKHWIPSKNSIQKYMPHWKYVLLSDEDNLNFVKMHFPDYLQWFKDLKYPIQRADVIRYMWLYVHGGIYMDLDIELIASIELLFKDGSETYLIKAPRNLMNHFTNFLMASKPRNKFWLRVLNECRKPLEWWVVLPHHIISQQTGISCLNRAVKNWEFPVTVLPYNFLVPCDYCSEDLCTRPYYYVNFLPGKSWNNMDTHLLNFFSCHYDILLMAVFTCVIYFMLKKR